MQADTLSNLALLNPAQRETLTRYLGYCQQQDLRLYLSRALVAGVGVSWSWEGCRRAIGAAIPDLAGVALDTMADVVCYVDTCVNPR
jgi:hypothetical protein